MTSHSAVPSRTVILTGGTSGLGYACARALARSDTLVSLILASRSQQAAQAVKALQRETGHRSIEYLPLDLASLTSIRAFVRDFAERSLPPLQAVICNAAIQVVSGTTYTQDGFETTFGVNCLGHFLLVNLLLRHLVAPARIIFVSSGTHYPATHNALDRLMGATSPRYRHARALAWPDSYPDAGARSESLRITGTRRYSTSKLCDIFYAYELSRRLQAEGLSTQEQPIAANAFDPGLMPGTKLARDYSFPARFAWHVLLPSLRFLLPHASSPDTSGKALARLVLDPGLEGLTGKYFARMEAISSSEESYDRQKAAELWETSAELVQLQPTETILAGGNSLDTTDLFLPG
ncbi:MAG TPA: SDR family NAD(P)-dependent oxidoreductase [Ktedonobacteraceae bacterium]